MFEIGAMLNNLERDRIRAWEVARELAFRVVHTSALPEAWLPALASPGRQPLVLDESDKPGAHAVGSPALYLQAARASGLSVHSMFVGFDGQSYTDLASAARTVGLAVPELRAQRLAIALLYPDAAEALRATSLSTHLGHLPPTSTTDYTDLLTAIRDLADACAARHLTLHLETGQEPAAVLLRLLIDMGRTNVGVNFDAANFVLYGTDRPLEAMETLGPWIRGVHCKDALPSDEPGRLGTDVPLGQGVVPWRTLVERLLELGYEGPWIIEREHGPQVRDDFVRGRAYLEALLRSTADR
jgi:sugar phosphate isomerase/epimerase